MSKKISKPKSITGQKNNQSAKILLRAYLTPRSGGQPFIEYSISDKGNLSGNLADGRSHAIDRIVIYDAGEAFLAMDLIPFDDDDNDERQSKIQLTGAGIEIKGNIRCLLEGDGNVGFESILEINNGNCRFRNFTIKGWDFVKRIPSLDPLETGNCTQEKLTAGCLKSVLEKRRRYTTEFKGGPPPVERKVLAISFIKRGSIFKDENADHANVLMPHFAMMASDLRTITDSHTLFNILTGLQVYQRPALNNLLVEKKQSSPLGDILDIPLGKQKPHPELVTIQIPGEGLVPKPRAKSDAVTLQVHFYGIKKPGYDFWNEEIVKVYTQSQLGNKGGSPSSFLPGLAYSNNQRWGISYKIEDTSGKNRLEETDFGFSWLEDNNRNDITIIPAAFRLLDGGRLTAEFGLVKTHSGKPLQVVFDIRQAAEKWISNPANFNPSELNYSEFNRKVDNRKKFAFIDIKSIIDVPSTDRQPLVRAGAMDLEFGGIIQNSSENTALSKPQLISADFRYVGEQNGLVKARPQDVEIFLQLPLKEIRAGGQDDVLGENALAPNATLRLTTPCEIDWNSKDIQALPLKDISEEELERLFIHRNSLVIDPEVASLNSSGTNANYLVDITEKALQLIDQTLSLAVNKMKTSSNGEKSPPLNAIVLDSDPFTIAKVVFQALEPITNQIGTWYNNRGWQLLTQTEPFNLILPPQGIGEEMEKKKGDINPENKLLDFRLSPPAKIKLQPSQEKKNFTEPPWNLRRLLAYDGQEKSGAGITHLSFELLYGLSCSSEYPFLRLAEIASRVGLLQGRLPQVAQNEIGRQFPDEYKKLRLEWGLTYRKFRSRIAIFEPWHAVQTDSLLLNANTTCRIRNVEEGAGEEEVAAADLRPPVPVNSNSDPGTKLGGGVTWGFESRNIYNAVMRTAPGKANPESPADGTEIRNLRFSSLGGWGNTKAAFDKKRSTISADVNMGATYLYKLERIGRIGVWWNLAKHVIVYKRTVMPSRQMDKYQDPLKGRPIIRKVEEYVEILEPVRNYPDGANAQSPEAQRVSGFVKACAFQPGAKFNVLSSWGQDVGDLGWKVPLWKPYQTPEDLYPKPQAFLQSETRIEGLAKTTPCLIDNPDNLYFYTDTRAETDSNPNKWPPIPSVDFVNMPICKPLEDFTGGDKTQTTPNDAAVHPGYSPCTFSVSTSGLPIDLAANRGLKPMFADLQNITMMRALPKLPVVLDWKDNMKPHERLFIVRQKSAEVFQELLRLLPQVKPGEKLNTGQLEALKTDINRALNETGGQFDKIKNNTNNLKSELLERVSGIKGSLGQQKEKIKELVTQAEQSVFRRIEKQLLEKTKDADGLITALQKEIDVLLATKKADFNARRDAYVAEARQKFSILQEGLRIIYIPRSTLTNSLTRAANELKKGLADIRKEAESAERFVNSLGNLPNDKIVDENLTQLRARLRPVIVSYEKVRTALESKVFGSTFDWLPQLSEAKIFSDLKKTVEAELAKIRVVLNESSDSVAAEIEVKKQLVLGLLRDIKRLADPAQNTEYQKLETELVKFNNAARVVEDKIGAFLDIDNPNSWLAKQFAMIGTIPIDPVDSQYYEKFIRICQDFRDSIDFAKRPATCDPNSTNLFGQLNCVEVAVIGASLEWIDYVTGSVTSAVDDFLGPYAGVAQTIENKINEIIGNISQPLTTARREIEKIRDEFVKNAESMVAATVGSITPPAEVLAVADSFPRIIRAFGKPPEVPNLSFGRPEVAYFYDAADKAIGITPVLSRVRQAGAIAGEIGEALQPLGIDLPTKAFLENLIPPALTDFKLSDIFPKFAGLDLTDLFSGIKLPNLNSEGVKITHGVEAQSRRAWTQADVNVNIAQDCQVFTIGAISVILRKAKFEARMRFDISPDGPKRTANGKLTGKWDLIVGGTNLVGFKNTTLSFDDSGKFNFNISPTNVELAAALSFISDFLKQFSDPESGFSIGLTPTGVRAILSLPIPPIKSGTSGISNLYLGVAFGIEFGEEGFAITLGFLLGRKDAPFNLAIFLLGGGGYIEVTARYVPSKKNITCSVEIGIAVSASLGINLGVISGCVEIFLGVNVRFTARLGSSKTSLKVGMFLLIRGEVSVLGIVSAGISLLLETEYENGEFTARGRFTIKIKICWCYTLKVNKQVEYKVGGGKGQAQLNPAPARDSLSEFKKQRRQREMVSQDLKRQNGATFRPASFSSRQNGLKANNQKVNPAPAVPPKVIDYPSLADQYVSMVF